MLHWCTKAVFPSQSNDTSALTRQKPIADILPADLRVKDMYDNVSMQFCMHYAFESASKARMMMENVSRFLRPGGTFIGTIPDSDLLL
jgi:mRNA (guanine-N7-)-methyltransferase